MQQEPQSRWDEADRLRRLQVDRARYESELARRRSLRVDPDNRLVAASLEAEWNAKLRALSEAEQNYERQRQADEFKVSAAQREQVLALATDFPRLWNDPGTPNRERKRMVRLLIEDITIRKGEQIQLDVRFRGGVSKTLMLPRPLRYCESYKQNPEMVAEMDRLLEDYNYADTARILKEKGFKTGDGLPLTSIAVGYVRNAYGLKSRFDRLRERGLLTISEMARVCGVSINTIGHWRQRGLVRAYARFPPSGSEVTARAVRPCGAYSVRRKVAKLRYAGMTSVSMAVVICCVRRFCSSAEMPAGYFFVGIRKGSASMMPWH
jgi:hypothetical protein